MEAAQETGSSDVRLCSLSGSLLIGGQLFHFFMFLLSQIFLCFSSQFGYFIPKDLTKLVRFCMILIVPNLKNIHIHLFVCSLSLYLSPLNFNPLCQPGQPGQLMSSSCRVCLHLFRLRWLMSQPVNSD